MQYRLGTRLDVLPNCFALPVFFFNSEIFNCKSVKFNFSLTELV